MPWLSSLFPFELPSLGLPTFSIPVSIQRRFFSFILRRALGKFLKPGQLEANQIEAQIGSGSIDITELELDDEVSPNMSLESNSMARGMRVDILLRDISIQESSPSHGHPADLTFWFRVSMHHCREYRSSYAEDQ